MRLADKLHAHWSKRERDLLFCWPDGRDTQVDRHMLGRIFSREVREELASRGYDLTTLRFSIAPRVGEQRFASQRPACPG